MRAHSAGGCTRRATVIAALVCSDVFERAQELGLYEDVLGLTDLP
jgi:hypothetical protein